MPSFEDVSKEPEKFMSEGEIKESDARERNDKRNLDRIEELKDRNHGMLQKLNMFVDKNEKELGDELMYNEQNHGAKRYSTEGVFEQRNAEIERTKKMYEALVEFKKALNSKE
jgi:hypothetical protein